MTVDRELLLKVRLAEEAVEIPGVGEVRVRALSRAELMEMHEGRDGRGQVGTEVFCLVRGLVAPALSEDDVRELLAGSPGGELQPVVDAIMRLSGMTEGAQKSP